MGIPTNTYTRVTASTNVREDLIDKITMTNPEQTPVISASGKATADNTFHEWQRDSLRAANKDNAALDGEDATNTAKTPPNRVANNCQIFQDTIQVSGRASGKKAGMKSAMAYYKAKAYKEIQRDMEAAVVSKNLSVADNGTNAGKFWPWPDDSHQRTALRRGLNPCAYVWCGYHGNDGGRTGPLPRGW